MVPTPFSYRFRPPDGKIFLFFQIFNFLKKNIFYSIFRFYQMIYCSPKWLKSDKQIKSGNVPEMGKLPLDNQTDAAEYI